MTELISDELPKPEVEFVTNPTDASPEGDSEAPYGRKKDGTPKKRPGRPSGSAGVSTPRSKPAIERQLADRLGQILIPIGLMSPLAGAVIDAQVDNTAKGVVILMGDSPRFKQWMEKSIKAEAVWNIVGLPIGIGLAFNVERGNLHPDHFICKRMGISDAFRDLWEKGWRPAFMVREMAENSDAETAAGNGHVETRSGLFGEHDAES